MLDGGREERCVLEESAVVCEAGGERVDGGFVPDVAQPEHGSVPFKERECLVEQFPVQVLYCLGIGCGCGFVA